jgi:hypothetical protein
VALAFNTDPTKKLASMSNCFLKRKMKQFMWEIMCRERDLPRKSRKNWETKNAEINNVYMELYSGAKMVNEKCEIENREFTVFDNMAT